MIIDTRYQVLDELGRGGMATVFRARDTRLDRTVAIKLLPALLLHDAQFRIRFEREAKVVARLAHPNIVTVHDYGEHEGQPFLVMPFMAGGSLDALLKRGPLPFERSVRVIAQLAPALDYAHAAGFIHRDLKPGNILFDDSGNAFLADFGIVKMVESTSVLTGTGNIIGTPAYMSPEQINADENIDHRTDIYALGVILHHMVTGRMPYEADTPVRQMMMHVMQPVPDLSQTHPHLPAQAALVVRRAMAKAADDRFTTASAMAAALRTPPLAYTEQVPLPATLIEEPPASPPPTAISPAPEAAPTRRRMNLLPLVGGGLFLCVVIAGVVLGAQFIDAGTLLAALQPTQAAADITATASITPEGSITAGAPTGSPPADADVTPTLTLTPTAGATPTLTVTPSPTETLTPLEAITQRRTLLVARSSAENGPLQTFEVTLMAALVEQVFGQGVAVSYVPVNAGEALAAVQSGRADAAMDSLQPSTAQSDVTYTVNYFLDTPYILAEGNAGILTLSDIDGSQLIYEDPQTAEIGQVYLPELGVDADLVEMSFDDVERIREQIEAELAAGVLGPWSAIEPLSTSFIEPVFLGPTGDEVAYAVAVNAAAPALRDALSEGLATLVANGTYDAIYRGSFNQPTPWATSTIIAP